MDLTIPKSVRATVPRLDQYFGTWSIHENVLAGLMRYLETNGVENHVNAARKTFELKEEASEPFHLVAGGDVAVIPIFGLITKSGTSLSDFPGTTMARATIRELAQSPDVNAIVLQIDSPGGSVKGVDDLARDIASAAERKPVIAFIDDLAASAAYYLAAGATTIVANPSAIVGAIGVYAILIDSSEQAAREGIKVHVIKSGELKAIGTPGAEVSDNQLEEVRRLVARQHEMFVGAVAKGRGISRGQVEVWATGQVWIGDGARLAGLVDRIGTFDLAIKVARELASDSRFMACAVNETSVVPDDGTETITEIGEPMSGTDVERATIVALKRALPKSDAEFREECVLQGRTVSESKDAYIDRLESDAPAPRMPGVEPIKTRGKGVSEYSDGDATAQWEEAVATNKASGMAPQAAVFKANREHPGLREAMIEETNSPEARAERQARRR